MSKSYKQDGLFIVELSDTEWYGLREDERTKAGETFKERALSLGCRSMSIFCLPDPFFPLCDNNKRHRVYECIITAITKPYEIKPLFAAEIAQETWDGMTEADRRQLVRDARDEVNAMAVNSGISGRYVIRTFDGATFKVIEGGKV